MPKGHRRTRRHVHFRAFRQVRGKIEAEFADIGEQSLKNIARPLRVYSIGPISATEQLAT